LSWALPTALAGSYFVYRVLSTRLEINSRRDIFLLPTTFVASVILVVGLYSTYGQGSLGLERYSDVPAFAVFMITSAVAGTMMVRQYRKPIAAIVIGLLVISLALGGTQLNWAPDQFHSSYGYTTQQDFYSSRTILNFLPNNIVLYYAQTLQFLVYWNQVKNLNFTTPGNLATSIDSNRSATPYFLISYVKSQHTPVLYLFLGMDQFTNYSETINSPHIDVVYSNGQYYGILAYR
jgi:hypothetical protein